MRTGWLAVQEAAKQVVSLRLRTHFGNPTQTFAALESALHHAASAPLGSGSLFAAYRSARLFLEFMEALERGIFAACEGSVDREEPSASLMSFFTANRKVRTFGGLASPRSQWDSGWSSAVSLCTLA